MKVVYELEVKLYMAPIKRKILAWPHDMGLYSIWNISAMTDDYSYRISRRKASYVISSWKP